MHHNETKTPLIRLAKRGMMEPWKAWCIRVGSILVALLLGGLVMSIALPEGSNIFSAYGTIIEGALGKKTAIRQTIKLAVPLLGTALAIAPCFKMRFWNIGAEGQITAGAMAASYFALYCYDKMSSPVLLIVMGVSAALLGGIWAFIPGFFKAKWNTNETLFTLMMNYIMIGIVRWLKGGPWEGRPGSQIIPNFDKAAVLPKVFGVHCGWIIVLVLVVFMHIYMKYTKHGYEIAVIGDSVNTARYAGMNVGRIMMRTMFLSGAICGLVGFMVASGANMTLSDTVAAGNGFTAITVAWLSQLNAFAMIVISLMLAILSKGAETLQTRLMVPTSISDIITGILLFCMLGCEFFINYQILTERSGNLNLCVEGIMFMGCAFGLGGVFYYEQAVGEANSSAAVALLIALASAFAAGAIASLIFSFLTITLRANQNVTGLALTIFGTGVGQFTGEYMRVHQGGYVALSNHLKEFFSKSIFPQGLQNIPVAGKLLFSHSLFFYLALVLAVIMWWFLYKTRTGLHLRSVGENPATADAAGINVTKFKYLSTIIGGGISAIGGMVYIVTTAGCVWNHEGLSGVGWLAVALVIFCMWHPLSAIWGSIFFGALMILYLRLIIPFIPTQLYKILPYLVTVIVLVISSMRNNKEKQPPASLGLPYFREDR